MGGCAKKGDLSQGGRGIVTGLSEGPKILFLSHRDNKGPERPKNSENQTMIGMMSQFGALTVSIISVLFMEVVYLQDVSKDQLFLVEDDLRRF